MGAWRGFLRSHSLLTAAMSATLEREFELTLSEYEVLLHLAEHPEGRMAMTELANGIVLTPSGITRLIDRLVARGYIVRAACPTDARRQHAVLTATGRSVFTVAGRAHLADIRERFLAHASAEEQLVMGRVWERVIEAETSPNEPDQPMVRSVGQYGRRRERLSSLPMTVLPTDSTIS